MSRFSDSNCAKNPLNLLEALSSSYLFRHDELDYIENFDTIKIGRCTTYDAETNQVLKVPFVNDCLDNLGKVDSEVLKVFLFSDVAVLLSVIFSTIFGAITLVVIILQGNLLNNFDSKRQIESKCKVYKPKVTFLQKINQKNDVSRSNGPSTGIAAGLSMF